MADLTSNIDFTAVFRTQGRTLTLQNTGAYGSGVFTYRWIITPPSGIPQIALGKAAEVLLLPATDGTFQFGVYSIQAIVNDTLQDSSLTRTVNLTLADVRPALVLTESYTTPSAIFSDTVTYYQHGYTTQSVIRAWSATRSTVVTTGSNSTIFNLGVLYRDTYEIKQAAVVTYLKPGAAWVTLIHTYTAQQTYTPNVFPSLSEMLNWSGEEDCSCEDGNGADCLRKAVTDFFCNGNIDQAYRKIQQLYRETHDRQAYRPVLDGQVLAGVDYCPSSGTALSIATQPVGGNMIGGVLQLTVVLTGGTTPYTYQWYKDSTTITGATAAAYVATAAGNYYVVANDAAGATVTSNSVAVSVASLQPPTLGTVLPSGNSVYVPVTPADGATSSVISLSPNADFSGTPVQKTAANGQVEFTGLNLNTTYYVKGVSLKTGSANSTDSGVQSVKTYDTIRAVSGQSSGNGTSIAGVSGFEVHYDAPTAFDPPQQTNDFIIGGQNVGYLSFQFPMVDKPVAVVLDTTHYYKLQTGTGIKLKADPSSQGVQIVIS